MWHFLRSSHPKRVQAISKALAALLDRSNDAYDALVRQSRAKDLIRHRGWLKVYSTQRGFARTAAERALMERQDVTFEILSADDIRQLEGGLAPIFQRGLYLPDCAFVVNPKRLIETFASDLVERGGRIIRAAVTGFARSDAGTRVLTDGGPRGANIVVLAAGAWSRILARQLGAKVPLDTERGYHLMLPPAEANLSRPVLWGDHYFGLVPMEQGIRLTSGIEFAGLEAPPDYRRIERILSLAQRMLPGLPEKPESRWLGFRPSLPDSLPVLGAAPGWPGAYFAFGHHHLGFTLGPVTGRIVADLAAGRDPGLDLSPYRADRW